MVVQSKILDVLPADYGFVVLTGVGSVLLNFWLAQNVMRARKEYNVKFPALYSPDNEKFNCIQRAHQNTLESLPQFLLILTFGGLQYPRISAGAGTLYLLGRIAYALGYSTGDPEKRRWGAFGYIGFFVLIGNTISFAAHQLKWVGK